MSAPIAVRASYADFKLLKTRSVFQVVLEGPIEKAEDFVTAFGLPVPGKERPVALALLNPSSTPSDRNLQSEQSAVGAPRPVEATQALPQAEGGERAASKREAPQRCPTAAPDRLVQYVAIACGDPKFRGWLKSYAEIASDLDQQSAAEVVRQLLGVKSRAELSTNPVARQKALALMADYDVAMGRVAEDRS